MENNIKISIASFLLLFFTNAINLSAQSTGEILETGLEKVEAGEFEEAAEVWAQVLEFENTDFRIAQELIRLVTKHELKEYYEDASELYNQSLGGREFNEDEAIALHQELFYINSMIGRRETRSVERLIDNKNPEAFNWFRQFWQNLDPTPTNSYNERLLEHWERVNFAIENFAIGPSEEFDARGEKYISYGPPQRKHSGTLYHDPGFASYILATRMEDGVDGTGSVSGSTMFLNTLYQVRDYYNPARFEIWIYTNLTDNTDDTPFIFGNENGGQVMSIKNSVDDFIPTAAFSTGGRNEYYSHGMSLDEESDTDVEVNMDRGITTETVEIPPAVVLQIMYYRQLSTIDSYFSSRYDDMLNKYESTVTRISPSIAREFQQLNISQIQRTQNNAPSSQSSYIVNIYEMEVDLYTYRFLDDHFNPYLWVYHQTDSDKVITIEELKNKRNANDINQSDYQLISQLSFYETDEKLLHSIVDTVVNKTTNPLNENLIKLSYGEDSKFLETHVELHHTLSDRGVADNSTFKDHLKGIGISKIELKEKLKSEGFAVSDVILGYTPDSASVSNSNLILSHEKRIPENSSLNFYYEAYNIPKNSDGLYEYSLTYTIQKKRSRLKNFFSFGRNKNEASISINNLHDEAILSQQLEIVGNPLEVGDYNLELSFTNKENDLIYQTEIEFSVVLEQ